MKLYKLLFIIFILILFTKIHNEYVKRFKINHTVEREYWTLKIGTKNILCGFGIILDDIIKFQISHRRFKINDLDIPNV